jgi:PAS domain S-box-containing protein
VEERNRPEAADEALLAAATLGFLDAYGVPLSEVAGACLELAATIPSMGVEIQLAGRSDLKVSKGPEPRRWVTVPLVVGGVEIGRLRLADGSPALLDPKAHASQAGAAISRLLALLAFPYGPVAAQGAGVVVLDSELRVKAISERLARRFGYEPGDLKGRLVLEFIHPADLGSAMEILERTATEGGQRAPYDVRLKTAAGDYLLCEVLADTRLDDPVVAGIAFAVRPVADRPRRESLLAMQSLVIEDVLRGQPTPAVAESLGRVLAQVFPQDCVVLRTLDPDRGVLVALWSTEVSEDLARSLSSIPAEGEEWPHAACLRRLSTLLIPSLEAEPRFREAATKLEAHGFRAVWVAPAVRTDRNEAVGTVEVLRKERGMPTYLDMQMLLSAAALLAASVLREEVMTHLREQARRDGATGLLNRLGITEILDEWRGARPGVALLEVSNSENLANLFGYQAVDAVVGELGRRAKALLGQAEVGRFSTDVLAVVCRDRRLDWGEVGRLLFRLASEPVSLGEMECQARPAVGVCVPDADEPSEQIWMRADFALACARKERGRAGEAVVICDQHLSERMRLRAVLEHDFSRAIRERQFTLYLQPVYSRASFEVSGLEVLLRWSHPKRGLLAPGEFLEIAEEGGHARELTDYVLEEVARMLSENPRATQALTERVWVNVFPQDLSDKGFVDRLVSRLQGLGLDPHKLGIEIVERSLVEDPSDAKRTIGELLEAGFGVAIDDFGSGYSSLSSLAELPVSHVKIDRSLVAKVTETRQLQLVRTLVGLIHYFGAMAVAEGVETHAQLDVLVACQVDYLQGFYLARPRPADEALRELSSR